MTTRSLMRGIALVIAGCASSGLALAECADTVQCIGISANSPAEAERNHHGGLGRGGTTSGSTLVIMDFNNRPVASSTVRILYVAAAQGPVGAVVRLDPIRITGPHANQFSLVGGTCALNGGNGPTHGANNTGHCTIEVRFTPTSPGPKTALLTVPFPQPRAGFIDHRDATLTGIGGDERISPALDATVAPLIASQVDSLRRFGSTQVSNIAERLASLQRARGRQAAGRSLTTPIRTAAALSPPFPPGGDAAGPAASRPGIDGLSAGGESATRSAVPQLLAALVTSGQVPLMLASDSGARPGASDGGYWLGGVASFGRLGSSGPDSRFETSGITAGADRRLGPGLILGGAVGYSRAHHDFARNGSDSRNTGQSLALYGSYEWGRNVHVDAILGYGGFESRSNRYATATSSLARSERDGSQVFGSLGISQAWHDDSVSWAPYARLEFGTGTLDSADETGAGIASLSYLEQKVRSSRLALGLRASVTRDVGFGRVTPQLRLEVGRDLTRVGAATIAYADQPGGPTYVVLPTTGSRNSRLLAVGAEFLTHGGVGFGFELGSNGRFGSNPEYVTRFWLSTALDGDRSRPEAPGQTPSKAPFTVSTAFRHDDNITRTGNPTPKLSDRIWVVSAGLGDSQQFSDSLSLAYGAEVAAEKFQTHDSLDSTILGVNAELAFQAGGHFAAPRFGLFASAAYDDARSALRKGHRVDLGLNARMLVAERTGLSGVLSHNRRRAQGELYDTDVNVARVGVDHQVGDRATVRLGLEARHGDFVSSGRGMADSAAISEVQVDDDAFVSRRFVAYRFPARSLIAGLGYTLSLGSRDSLALGWSAIRVKPTQAPDYTRFPPYPTQGLRGEGGSSPYSVQQIDITYRMQF